MATMAFVRRVVSAILCTCAVVSALNLQGKPFASPCDFKRSLKSACAAGVASLSILASAPSHAVAAPQPAGIPMYFGIGCFWHVQHEFVETERKVLGRDDQQLTSFAGYAGGNKLGKNPNKPGSAGIVCYHNLMGVADYGKLGYGEVVGMQIPESSFRAFADEYFSLFGSDKERPDKGDRGSEYRSLVGIPGGVQSPLYPALQAAADAKGLRLMEGKGNDADTLGKKMVWVMDSDTFPFKPAEVYHQYHDGFMPGEQYPEKYNSLAKTALEDKRIDSTGCPDVV